jgi:hypothetical protein
MKGVLGQVFGFPTGQNFTPLQQSEYGDFGRVASTVYVSVLKQGSRGAHVRLLHDALFASGRVPSNILNSAASQAEYDAKQFGGSTAAAVWNYQMALWDDMDAADKIVGKNTWAALSKDTGSNFKMGSGSTGGSTNASNALDLAGGGQKEIDWKMILGVGGGVLALLALLGVLLKKKKKTRK